ncbi:aminomethyl-transferring glycine dehydrogenase [Pelomonas aquatica]|jgi:glycine dehydrogenase|uniref:Glycine dehydrogenase (decarboxylating) n=1 Tax=Pelomonas aquatica TaxID=431058 RepID=A0A9X4LE28_9BURK|nr:aminomethyl-transferring glycine dehydrogenase [Pelomonas aquatica]MCY4754913.1 aminomethyl-transferring glycine dehydrogenase [Pelomonas aquatica]MDG0861069.1 glycine dehydrogenase (aminomethyl-transferring) [Pelomonas aquatica]
MPTPLAILEDASEFHARHIGPDAVDESLMCAAVGVASRSALIDAVVPASIRRSAGMQLPAPITEAGALAELKAIAGKNKVYKSFIGQGYSGTHTPGVILRNILENPAWYTAYTPYQAEISQGRMEALVNFQTMVADLTGMDIANGSMLDEATSAAEAVTLTKRSVKSKSNTLIVASDVHPQTIEVIQTRCAPLGISVLVGMAPALMAEHDYFAVVCQYPSTTGLIHDLKAFTEQAHAKQAAFIVCADLLALTLLVSPGEFGADIVVGNTQRFGMPMGAGGPHAAFLACRDEFKRSMPGRLVGVSKDAQGHPAYRLALQTREQHIRREKATSNICTAQVLPAVVASMYAVYHGPQGLKRIAERVASYTAILHAGLVRMGVKVVTPHVFDTLMVECDASRVMTRAVAEQANLRRHGDKHVGVALDETTSRADIEALWRWFAPAGAAVPTVAEFAAGVESLIPAPLRRTSAFLTHPVFNTHHSETEMLRYIRSLSDKDLALDRSMIPLGSCTMKLNATAEMIPITWPEFAGVHPFAPQDQLAGYAELDQLLQNWLSECTGYAGISLQPNAGSQGEYAGLLAIKAWHESRGDAQRNICLIPESAHGTNPASAGMVGMQVVVTKCDKEGNIDLVDLKAKCEQHAARLAAIMITYPSTYGVFDTHVKEICAMVKAHGGRVYVDGANMNALVGVAAPGQFGGDVSHLNLHKTFCIPHGGGGPGVGPVCVVEDLVPFLPAHRTAGLGQASNIGAVSAAPLGNAAVLPISWMYIRLMGADGLKKATEMAILNANYVAARLSDHYDIHFSGGIAGVKGGGVAHECILDLRPLKDSSGVAAEDVAKRLIDYGFHAPTLSFPVAGTLMVEPTESESRAELDRFIDAMIQIRHEIADVEAGKLSREDNPLVNAPHTAMVASATEWAHGYSREVAVFPLPSLRRQKYWSPVGRVDNVYGDRNLFCSCVPLSEYEEA